MRLKRSNRLLDSLKKLRRALEIYCDARSRSAAINELDQVILGLSDMRTKLTHASAPEKTSATLAALDEILGFLERAKSDSTFQVTFSETVTTRPRQNHNSQIPPNLTNQQIRELLQRDLSKSELEEIAKQRSISLGKRSKSHLRSAILDFIERQESYERLRA